MSGADVKDRVSRTTSDAATDPLLESLNERISRHLKRRNALLLAGLCMPMLLGIGNELLMRLFDLGWVGMDDYVPFMSGAFVGVCLGLLFGIASMVEFMAAIACRRQKDRLSS